MAVEISLHQYSICQEANGQFCNIITPFQMLMNPPSCITTLYTEMHVAFLQAVHYKSGRLKASVYPHKLQPMYGY